MSPCQYVLLSVIRYLKYGFFDSRQRIEWQAMLIIRRLLCPWSYFRSHFQIIQQLGVWRRKSAQVKYLFNSLRSISHSLLSALLLPATKLHQGNVFTPVCHSVHRGVAHPPPGQTPPCPVHAGIHTSPCPVHAGIHSPCTVHAGIRRITVNKRAVRILLECILVRFGDTLCNGNVRREANVYSVNVA